jgi:CubicO group peptidase (beta-lactamase class C family)
MRMIRTHFAFILGLIVVVSAAGARPAVSQSCDVPAARDDGWAVAAPAAVGLDAARLCAIPVQLARLREANIHAVLVARHGKLVFERYFAGEDETWGNPIGVVTYGPDMRHDLRSVSKNVVSLLFGIALDRKLIAGIDEPVYRFFPEHAALRTPAKDRILLRHLLTMSAGYAWNETVRYNNPANSEVRMSSAADPYGFVLEQPVTEPPGTSFNYSGGATMLLAGVIQKAAGKPLEAFAQETLFGPLGITDVEWVKMPSREAAAASGLRLRPRDLAKLGQLVLARGQWNGKQIVSADWIARSTTPQIEAIDFLFFGHHWWLGRSLVHGREVPWIAGLGLGGQRLFIVPALDLVVVITAGHYASPIQRWLPWEIFRRHVVDAVGKPQ